MANIDDPEVSALLAKPNVGIVSTFNEGGSIHSAVVWQEVHEGKMSVNSAIGRHWPNNLERDARVNVLVYAQDNPMEYVEIRGTATGTTDGADEQINRLAKKYIGADEYPFRQPGEQRIRYDVAAERIRYQKQ